MKTLFLSAFILVSIFSLVNFSNSTVSAESETNSLELRVLTQPSIQIDVDSYVVFDIETGEIILSQNPDKELPIASITKLFTAKKLLETDFNQKITITREDVETEGRAGKLSAGEEYEAKELIFPLLLESSNDAATAIERNIGKITLADKTLFDGSGLSSRNKSTAKELSSEVRDIYKNLPYIFDVTTLKQYVSDKNGWVNNSPVRDLEGYKGGKHGFTYEANRTLVAVFSEKKLDNRELGYILLGSDDLRSDVIKLRSLVEDSVRLE
ncbi:D-alanyl-D-alanine carboxypeptidase [Candidatus Kaiserbacteria bacterium]|nr:D-alanyl-D-alanine carboxypeptidase [Candidatus Kaiserbacteria bacterium]